MDFVVTSIGVYVQSSKTSLCDRLSHNVPSTVVELAAVCEAIGYIIAKPLNSCCILSTLGPPSNPFLLTAKTALTFNLFLKPVIHFTTPFALDTLWYCMGP